MKEISGIMKDAILCSMVHSAIISPFIDLLPLF